MCISTSSLSNKDHVTIIWNKIPKLLLPHHEKKVSIQEAERLTIGCVGISIETSFTPIFILVSTWTSRWKLG